MSSPWNAYERKQQRLARAHAANRRRVGAIVAVLSLMSFFSAGYSYYTLDQAKKLNWATEDLLLQAEGVRAGVTGIPTKEEVETILASAVALQDFAATEETARRALSKANSVGRKHEALRRSVCTYLICEE